MSIPAPQQRQTGGPGETNFTTFPHRVGLKLWNDGGTILTRGEISTGAFLLKPDLTANLQFGRFLRTVGLVLPIQILTGANFTFKGKQISLRIKTAFFFFFLPKTVMLARTGESELLYRYKKCTPFRLFILTNMIC